MRQRDELEVLMLSFHRGTKLCAAIVVAAIMLTGALSWSYAETGSVRLNIVKAGFIVGIGGGSGTLNFQGRDYQLSIGGINVGWTWLVPPKISELPGLCSACGRGWRKSRRTAKYERRGFKSERTRHRS